MKHVSAFQEVAKTDTGNAPLLTNLALDMVQPGNSKDAILIFERSLLHPIADAIARYQEALANDPNFAEAHRQLAVALAREGRTAEAEIERKKADDLNSPQP